MKQYEQSDFKFQRLSHDQSYNHDPKDVMHNQKEVVRNAKRDALS